MQLARVVPNFPKCVSMLLPYYLLLHLRICAVLVVTGMRASGVTGLHIGCTAVLRLELWNEKCYLKVVSSNLSSLLQVLENFIPPLLDAVLIDYQRTSVPSAREPEVLSAMGTIVHKLGCHITSEVPKIFDAVFECTLEMINKDFEEYPEHRTNFFLLLQVTDNYNDIHACTSYQSICETYFSNPSCHHTLHWYCN